MANVLCGVSRPGHFAGVATVVAKLFNIVSPQIAVFGQKDFQQLFIIRELVKQFNYPIQIIAGETVREPNGLALSSRNSYLSDNEKQQAAQLNQVLQSIVAQIKIKNLAFIALENDAQNRLNALLKTGKSASSQCLCLDRWFAVKNPSQTNVQKQLKYFSCCTLFLCLKVTNFIYPIHHDNTMSRI